MHQLSFGFEPAVDEIDICILSDIAEGIRVRPARMNEPRLDRLVQMGLMIALDAARELKHPGTSARVYYKTDVGNAWAKALVRSAA